MPSIAIIGASQDPLKYGNKAVRAYLQEKWVVYPVNPKDNEIEGLKCYASITDLPETPDYASLYLPPQIVVKVLDEIAEKGVKKVYFNPGTESQEGIEKAKKLGLEPLLKCSIRAIGINPDEL